MPSLKEPEPPGEAAWWFVFSGFRLLLRRKGEVLEVPLLESPADLDLAVKRTQYLGSLMGRGCYSAELEDEEAAPPEGTVFLGLRSVWGRLDDDLYHVAFVAVQVMNWDRTSQFCGRCGAATRPRAEERAKECPSCGFVVFPRLSPAVIVRVERNDQILLARSKWFAPGLYSVIAGFVEPGETLEETVCREVKEETGIEVEEIRYFGSQPWPFPDSLMIGFTARYKSGEITPGDEIDDAAWFTVDELPMLPNRASISRALIDSFVADHGGGGPKDR